MMENFEKIIKADFALNDWLASGLVQKGYFQVCVKRFRDFFKLCHIESVLAQSVTKVLGCCSYHLGELSLCNSATFYGAKLNILFDVHEANDNIQALWCQVFDNIK